VVAEWLNMPVEQIQRLNPELRRGMTPMGKHELKVPAGQAGVVEAQLASAGSSVFASTNFRFHTVTKGETLAAVARKYKITASKLAAANDLKSNSRVRSGTTLMVPTSPVSALASRKATSKPAPAVVVASSAGGTYRVKPGDTLYGIARHFDTSVESLKEINRLSSDAISIGDKLTVRR
jgi:membrane-bound lytic murein transglycosylase D